MVTLLQDRAGAVVVAHGLENPTTQGDPHSRGGSAYLGWLRHIPRQISEIEHMGLHGAHDLRPLSTVVMAGNLMLERG